MGAEESVRVQDGEDAPEKNSDHNGYNNSRSARRLALVPHQRPVSTTRHGPSPFSACKRSVRPPFSSTAWSNAWVCLKRSNWDLWSSEALKGRLWNSTHRGLSLGRRNTRFVYVQPEKMTDMEFSVLFYLFFPGQIQGKGKGYGILPLFFFFFFFFFFN
jgi:hypothetical protein